MPLANNPLLQATSVAKTQPAATSTAVKPAETGKDSASSFSQVFAKQADPKPTVSAEPRAKVAKDRPDVVANKPKAEQKTAADKTTVADNGKSLPADKTSKKAVADDTDKDDDDSTSADDKATGSTVADASTVDPVVDPSLTQAQPVQPTPDPAPPVAAVPPPTVDVPPTVLAAVTPPPAPTPAAQTKAFDPASDDPLAGLSAVQVALEQNGKGTKPAAPAQASTSATTGATASTSNADTDPAQVAVNNLAVPVDPQTTDSNSAGAGDKAFKNLIDDGLKDSTVATSDTKVDDFANRIAALSEAAQPKAVVAPTASPLAQPLAMHQSGWSEGVVNRVMYLSSQNLKSADIQLEPAELGRLDIRVNMAPDQQTQITFMSAHPAVREALEGQMGKLRDSFTQQGMGQVDVNVSDQSRGWNGQGQNEQQQANQSQRTGGGSVGSGSGDGLDGGAVTDVAQAAQPMKIIGTSQVDYYA